MGKIRSAFLLAAALFLLSAPAHGDESYDECTERDYKKGEEFVRKAEAAEKAGRLKPAFDMAAAPDQGGGCIPEGGYERMFGVVERTYKKLGQEAERSGRHYEAYKYYITPFNNYFRLGVYREREKDYSLADANRAMLNHAKAGPGDFGAVSEAVRHFDSFEKKPPELKEARSLAFKGGERHLEAEAREFSGRKHKKAFESLEEAARWFVLAGDEGPLNARARERVESLLSDGSYDSSERAFGYLNIRIYGNGYEKKTDEARARAGKLGDQAAKKSDYPLAERFYSLSGDESKRSAMSKKISDMEEAREMRREKAEKEGEKAEEKRREKFKKGQDSLEKELGF